MLIERELVEQRSRNTAGRHVLGWLAGCDRECMNVGLVVVCPFATSSLADKVGARPSCRGDVEAVIR